MSTACLTMALEIITQGNNFELFSVVLELTLDLTNFGAQFADLVSVFFYHVKFLSYRHLKCFRNSLLYIQCKTTKIDKIRHTCETIT